MKIVEGAQDNLVVMFKLMYEVGVLDAIKSENMAQILLAGNSEVALDNVLDNMWENSQVRKRMLDTIRLKMEELLNEC